ncbi:mucK [Symbiodinium sp. CCMP2456]|nr:mucK [Symbiodinium sp. CCMP2456]
MTVERPNDVTEWFESVPHLFAEQEWEVCERIGQSSLSHCHCPWGGRLLKLTISGIQVQNADTSKLLLRPEARAMHETRSSLWGCMELIEQLVSVPIVSRQTLCRAWPTNEDTTLMFSTNQCDPADALLICRPQAADQAGLVGIFAVSAEKFHQWMSTNRALWLDTALRAATHLLNRPGITDLRALDENMYTVLSIHSCKRGPPLLPLAPGSTEPAAVTIKTDERSQLGEWSRTPLGPDGKFRLVSFVKQFAANLGMRLKAYDSLDGQRLVHYQCAVRRDEWERIREEFLYAFLVQKRAYRRANGGSCAPWLAMDTEPRFAPDDRRVEVASQIKSRQQKPSQHKTVVRRTFIEVADDDSTEDEFAIIRERSNRRAKTFQSRNSWSSESD